MTRRIVRALECFNPRSRTGSDFRTTCQLPEWQKLQSTLPHGERLFDLLYLPTPSKLQSTLPHGERLLPRQTNRSGWVLQSTLPHGERLDGSGRLKTRLNASIHAPARGATRFLISLGVISDASIHAPARGATAQTCRPALYLQCFNPRSRTGSDLPVARFLIVPTGFNPRSRTGSDTWPCRGIWPKKKLQSTLPHGERQGYSARARCLDGFNPRSRTGSDRGRND